jgi:N-acetylneuraminic acid mutarotase
MSARSLASCVALAAVVLHAGCSTGDQEGGHPTPSSPRVGAGSKRAAEVVAMLTTMGLVPRASALSPTAASWISATFAAMPPSEGDAPLVVRRNDRPGAFLELTVVGAASIPAESSGSATVFAAALAGTDVVFVRGPAGIEELRLIATSDVPSIARWHLRKGDAIASVRVRARMVEAIDASGAVLFHADPMFVVDAVGARRDVDVSIEGDELVARWDASGLVFPVALDPAWSVLPKMASTRVQHTATTLTDGKVLVTGGFPFGAPKTATTEIYDPATNTWAAGTSMNGNRAGHTATRMTGGKILVAGGAAINATEIYDPVAKTWTVVGPLAAPRVSHEAVLLGSGKVLVVGGESCPGGVCVAVATAEIFDPGTNAWTSAGSMAAARKEHTVTLLPSGAVLVTGGLSATGTTLSSADIYEPTTNTWRVAGSMVRQHADHAAARVSTGVLVAGGLVGTTLSSVAELYDIATDTWKMVKPLTAARNGAVAITLGSGKVLVAGGAALTTAELFDPIAVTWTDAGTMAVLQERTRAALLLDGRVIFTGGNGSGGGAIAAVEMFAQSAAGVACVDVFDCASGFCVDGVCCDSACAGNCQACDVTATKGKCSDVTGAPHGARTCGGFTCNAGACGTTCATDAECAATHACSGGKCVAKKGNGVTCSAGTECSSASCVDGFCCDKPCTEQCNACDVPGKVGVCSPVSATPPHGARTPCKLATCSGSSFARGAVCNGLGACSTPAVTSCVPYACDDKGCRTACTKDSECAENFVCRDGACVARGAHCGPDNTSISADGVPSTCTPNLCRSDGTCGSGCNSTAECAAGFVCDDATKACIAAQGGGGDGSSGGCDVSRGESGSSDGVLLVALALIGLTRRGRPRDANRAIDAR